MSNCFPRLRLIDAAASTSLCSYARHFLLCAFIFSILEMLFTCTFSPTCAFYFSVLLHCILWLHLFVFIVYLIKISQSDFTYLTVPECNSWCTPFLRHVGSLLFDTFISSDLNDRRMLWQKGSWDADPKGTYIAAWR